MQPQQQQNSGQPLQGLRDSANLFFVICQLLGTWPRAWLSVPGSCGSHFFGFHAMAGWIGIVFWSGLFFPQHDQRPALWLWLGTAGILLLHRICSFRSRVFHSRYSGRPWLLRCVPFLKNEIAVKVGFEPLLMGGLGFFLLGVSAPVGSYLMLCAAAQGFTGAYQETIDRAEARMIRDAAQRQRYVMERAREME